MSTTKIVFRNITWCRLYSTGLYAKARVLSMCFYKMVFSTFLTAWVFIIAKGIHGEIFTSLSQLKGLVRLEGALSKTLDNYLEQQSGAPDIIRKFADHVRMESQIAKSDIERYVFHPINSFQLVRRFVRHWKELGSYLEKGTANGECEYYSLFQTKVVYQKK